MNRGRGGGRREYEGRRRERERERGARGGIERECGREGQRAGAAKGMFIPAIL